MHSGLTTRKNYTIAITNRPLTKLSSENSPKAQSDKETTRNSCTNTLESGSHVDNTFNGEVQPP